MGTRIFDGKQPYIAMDAFVDHKALVVGDVEIGSNSSIWPLSVLRGDVQAIRIGSNTNVQDGCVLHVTHPGPFYPGGFTLNIGDNVTIGHRAVLHGCTIKDQVLIGIGAIILDGVTVKSNVMIGAGSLVTANQELESGFLYHGSPAKKIRELTEDELKYIRYSAAHYVELKNQYLEQIQQQREQRQSRERDQRETRDRDRGHMSNFREREIY